MGQILSYPADTTPATGDKFLFQDGSTSATKYMTYGTLKDSIAGAAWQSWTPSLTNITIGNGTVVAKYNKAGKKISGYVTIVLGTTTSITGSFPTATLPETAATTTQLAGMCFFDYLDTGVTRYYGQFPILSATTSLSFSVTNVAGSYASESGASSTVPFTFGTGDKLNAYFEYEAP